MESKFFYGEVENYFRDALLVREYVFSDEQGFDSEIDHDEMDQKSWHVVLYDEKKPISTGRMFEDKGGNCFQIGRVAVLKDYRGQYLGQKTMTLLIEKAVSLNLYDEIVLHAQIHAITFYNALGFIEEGEKYFEEGEPHITMRRRLE